MKAVLLLLLNICFLNAQIVVVTNKDSKVDMMSKELVQYIYLAKIDKIEDVRVVPILSDDEKLHNQFCNTVLDKSESQYNSYWARLVFTGKKSISKRLDWQEMVEKLQKLNTIAYINKENLTDEWKIIYEEN